MKLTKQQLRAAARHARELADEVVEGRTPLGPSYQPHPERPQPYCWACALGTIARRIGCDALFDLVPAVGTDYEQIFAESIGDDGGALPPSDAFAFPLLAVADELENAALAAPKDLP